MSESLLAIAIGTLLALIGLGVAVLAIPNHPDRVKAAKLFFVAAALVFAGAMFWWTKVTFQLTTARVVCGVIAFVFVAIGLRLGFRFANNAFEEVSRRRKHQVSRRTKTIALIAAMAILAIATMIILIGYWLQPKVYKPFQDAYAAYGQRLGDPLTKEEWIREVYYAEHEKGTAIWLEPLPKVYLLRTTPKWTALPDPKTDNPAWYNDVENRTKLKMPPDCDPPYGNVAKGWYNDAESWKWLSCRRWHCTYKSPDVYVQRFQHGFIVGNLRRVPGNDSLSVQMVFIYDNDNEWQGDWFEVLDNRQGPPCIRPYEPKPPSP